MDQTSLEYISQQLQLGWVKYHESVTSTNDLAADWAAEGAPHFSLIAANHQTKGRGRDGRQWFTPPDSALAFSLLLRTERTPEDVQRFSGLGALAVCTALQQDYQQEAQIKWPNDVLLNGKKVCGVLPEALWMGDQLEAVILGIGINLTATAYPKHIPLLYPAISVEEATAKPVKADQFLLTVLTHLKTWFDKIDTSEFISNWEENLAFRGEEVEIVQGDQQRTIGRLTGLDTKGRIILHTPDQRRLTFSASEIHLRPFVDTPRK
jgi:BirA family biotin operon repressor/biotin-[acetyl-CoA-carboxylase] ligase